MKKVILVVFTFITLHSLSAVVVMPRVDAKLFVNKGRVDFDSIFNPNREKVEEAVQWLFDKNKLDHDFSKAVDPTSQFSIYWKNFAPMWNRVDLDNDGNDELIFSGKPMGTDEKELFSIYVQYGEVWKEVFWDDGHLMAYKKHPNTGEILLYHHRYPCCSQFTHMIQRIRWINNKLNSTKRYFLARDTAMNGQFFPKKANYPRKYKVLKSTTMLYWSKGIIREKAAQFSPTNAIIHFPKGSYFQQLATEGKWKYVMMVSPPIIEESMVANANNLQESRFYGWIKI